jgi:adenylate cyclase
MSGVPDFEAEGLLDDLGDAEDRAARLALLEELHAAGVPLEDLRQAVREERLVLLPVELELGGEGHYTLEEVVERSGLPADFLIAERLALGLARPDPDAREFTDADIEAAKRTALFERAGIPRERVLGAARVVGPAMATVAQAVRVLAGELVVSTGVSERDMGIRFAEMTRDLVPELGPMMEYVLEAHLREQLRRNAVTRAEMSAGRLLPDAQEMTVCFADLVDFTRLGERLPVDELGAVAGRLAELATDVAEPPVRLIKTIGDAAMFVSPEPPAMVDAAIALVEAAAAEGEGFPELKAGIACGPALSRGGDWYGHTVNLASRVTAIARADSVLVTEDVHEPLADSYRWSFAGERQLKGIKRPVRVFRARRPEIENLADGESSR